MADHREDVGRALALYFDAVQGVFLDFQHGAFDAEKCAQVAVAMLRDLPVEQRMEAMGMTLASIEDAYSHFLWKEAHKPLLDDEGDPVPQWVIDRHLSPEADAAREAGRG